MILLEVERACHRRWGWTNVPEPQRPAGIVGEHYEIHGAFECDDLAEAYRGWKRTGWPEYAVLMEQWRGYYRDRYLADLKADGYQQHTFGWGLLDVGGEADIAAVEAIAEWIAPQWGPGEETRGGPTGFYGVRGIARQLHLVARLAAVRPRWVTLRDRILDVMLGPSWWWDPRGFCTNGDKTTDEYLGAGTYERGARQASTLLNAIFSIAGIATLKAIGDSHKWSGELRARLLKMADWAEANALHPEYQQSGSGMLVEQDGRVRFIHYDPEFLPPGKAMPWEPDYTAYWITLLVWAGKVDRAAYHWDRACRAQDGTLQPRFVNGAFEGGSPFYVGNGMLQYVEDLFPAVERTARRPSWSSIPHSDLASVLAKYGGNPEGVLSYGGFALVVVDGVPWIVMLGPGGHSAWGPSLVAGFPLAGPERGAWQILHEPPMPVALAEHLPNHEYADGTPPAAHLYNGTQGLAGALAIRYGGSLWSEVTGNDPRVYLFDMKSRTYRRGADIPGTQGWSNPGSSSAVDPKTGEFLVWEVWGLFAYDATRDSWRQVSSIGRGGDGSDAYRTAIVDPIRREYLALGAGELRAVSLETGAVRVIPLTGSGAWIANAGSPGFAWDPDLEKAVAWANAVVIIDPVTGVAEQVEVDGDPPPPAREEGAYGAFRRFAPGQYVLMTRASHDFRILDLALDAVTRPPDPLPVEVPMKATYLGRVKGDVGERDASATPVDNERILLADIPEVPTGVTIESPGNGKWVAPKDATHWVPRILPQSDGTVILQFRSFGQYDDFTVWASFSGNRTATAHAEPARGPLEQRVATLEQRLDGLTGPTGTLTTLGQLYVELDQRTQQLFRMSERNEALLARLRAAFAADAGTSE